MDPLENLCLIRRATRNDAETVVHAINTICVEGGAFYVTKFVPSSQWEVILYRPETVPDHLLAIAEWEGRFAGAGRLFPGSENTLFRHVAQMGIFVLQPYRRKGIGKQLLAWMIDWTAGANLEKIVLSVFATNQPAIRLYRQFGFVEEGRQHRQLKVGDRYIDLLWMARFLSRSDQRLPDVEPSSQSPA